MPNYRRAFCPGGMFFFTVVTFDRQPILTTELGRSYLRRAMDDCMRHRPFVIEAIVLLPDHLHTIWSLPESDSDFSSRWAMIKRSFSVQWLSSANQGTAKRWQRRRSVWQPRFMEHAIRDEDDRDRHFDYVHYNPVKHGHAQCPHAWEWSSFKKLVATNVYSPDWGCACNATPKVPDFSWADVYAIE